MKSRHAKYIPSILLIIILGFAVYANSLHGEFIWDDNHLVKNNPHIKSWSHLPKIFTESIGRSATGVKSNGYRPLQTFSYLINHSISGSNSIRSYHLTNALLHVFVALCIYWLINILFRDRLLSFLTSVFFVVHPIHTEAVAYISGRADSLAVLFMLLSIIFYVKYLRSDRLILNICVCLSYVFALLSKESSLILPLLLLLCHYIHEKKIELKRFSPILAITFIYIF